MRRHDNTAVGISALLNNTTGSNNNALGGFADQSVTAASNVISIGTGGGNNDNMTLSKRFKEDIKPMENAQQSALRAQTNYIPLQKGD